MAKMPFSVSQEKSIRIADICCLIVAGEPECCSTYAATVIGSISPEGSTSASMRSHERYIRSKTVQNSSFAFARLRASLPGDGRQHRDQQHQHRHR
jgi:hypothetical protein